MLNARKVLILGASRYYSRSLQAARKAGYRVIAVDRDENSPGFEHVDTAVVCDIVDEESVLEVARKHQINGVVPVNDYGVPTAAFVAARLGLPGISEQAAQWATNKEAMRARWARTDLPSPRHAVATTDHGLRESVQHIGFPCILKPAHGIGGASRGVIVINAPEQMDEAIAFTHSFYDDKTTLVEAFVIVDSEHSAEVIVVDGEPHVIAIGDKVKTALPYRVDKSVIYPSRLQDKQRNYAVEIIREAVRSLEVTVGAAHVEFGMKNGGAVLFELGARCGGGGTPEPIVHYSTGVDEFVETVRILAGDKPVRLTPSRNLGCTYQFLTPEPGVVKSVDGVGELAEVDGILDVELFVRPGDRIRPVSVGTDRAGFVIAGGQTREEAYNLAKLAENRIRIVYEDSK